MRYNTDTVYETFEWVDKHRMEVLFEVMMGVFILLAIIGIAIQGFFQKKYNCNTRQDKISIYSFNLMLVISAMLFFIPQIGSKFNITAELFIYSLCFAVTYFCAVIFTVLAVKEGALSLTSLLSSYSLIIPTMYGVLFLNEEFGIMKKVGIAILLISLFFIGNIKKGEKVSKKWFLYVCLLFLGNGWCSTIQRLYQIKSGGENKAEFMVVALAIIAVAMIVIVLIKEKKISLPKIKNGGMFAVSCGLANGAVNMLTMILAKYPATIVYPTISAGGIVLTFILAKFIFKEKLSRNQYVGFVTGIISVIVLNM